MRLWRNKSIGLNEEVRFPPVAYDNKIFDHKDRIRIGSREKEYELASGPI